MSEKLKERNDSILGVIHEMYFLKTDNSKSYGLFDEIFRICPKWDKEKLIRFWE